MRIAVIGDAMVDLRRWGPSQRTSPEDPNCRVIDMVGQHYELGGAANVARWLAEGQTEMEVDLICQYACDETARHLQRLCIDAGVRLSDRFMRGGHYHTTLKERICVIHPNEARIEQFVRCDRDTNMVPTAHEIEAFIGHLVTDNPYDFYVIADYDKGMFQGAHAGKLLRWLSHFGCIKPMVVNSKTPQRWAKIAMSALICNEKESEALQSVVGRTDNDLHGEVKADYLVVTMSSDGVKLLHEPNGFFEIIYAESQADPVLDVTGAGDAFMAGFAYEMFRQSGTQPHMGATSWLDRGSEWAAQCCRQIGCGKPISGKEDKEGHNGTEQRLASLSHRGVGAG